jgi:hypothetical protein
VVDSRDDVASVDGLLQENALRETV